MASRFFVYMLSSKSRTLYVGVTRDLLRRILEHKSRSIPGFPAKYRIDRRVHFEESDLLMEAIRREKKLKGWRREKKTASSNRRILRGTTRHPGGTIPWSLAALTSAASAVGPIDAPA